MKKIREDLTREVVYSYDTVEEKEVHAEEMAKDMFFKVIRGLPPFMKKSTIAVYRKVEEYYDSE